MTFEELRRLARQTNWEKSRLLFILLKKILEIMDEDDYQNGYVKHLFNDENNELEIYILTIKGKLLHASYLYSEKTTKLEIQDFADIESLKLTEDENGIIELVITFSYGATIRLNNRENFDHEDKNHITSFAKSLYNA